ncbi:MAG TPA: hypothetical protein ENH82_14755 [bacterium]|nr:hypothetical protein [bacterium]
MKKQMTRITIDVEGKECGKDCPKLKITHDLFDRYVTFYWCHLTKPKTQLCKRLNDLPFQPDRCQLCVDATKEADEQNSKMDILRIHDDKMTAFVIVANKTAKRRGKWLKERDALIAELVDVLEKSRLIMITLHNHLPLPVDEKTYKVIFNEGSQALAHAKELMK